MDCRDTDDQALCAVADPMMDDIMQGLAHRNFTLHSQHFSLHLKNYISEEQFKLDCDQWIGKWGRPTQRQLVCIFKKPKAFTLIWHQSFTEADEDVLALTTVAVKGGRYFIDQFMLY
jgi:hypothetical protein